MILKQKGTRMAEDGEDWNGLKMTILKSLAFFSPKYTNDDITPLIIHFKPWNINSKGEAVGTSLARLTDFHISPFSRNKLLENFPGTHITCIFYIL